MKRIFTLVAIATLAVGGYIYNQKSNGANNAESSLLLANAEALSDNSEGSSSSWYCWSETEKGSGNVWMCGNPCILIYDAKSKNSRSTCTAN